MRLKPNTHAEFADSFEKQVVPTLRKQQGFKDHLLLVVPGGTEATGISLWDAKESAETYNRASYPEVLKILAKSIEGTPEVRTFEVASSSFYKIAARVAA
jgi:heme-degrading monooxygenase HmoA